jgi:hypothetical protein
MCVVRLGGLALLLALTLILTGSGSARPRVPAGPVLAVARPADDVRHPGSRTEWWYVHAIEPETGRTVIAVFFTAPIPVAAGFLYTQARMTHWTLLSFPQAQAGPGVRLAAGGIRYDAPHQRWLVDQQAPGYKLRLLLSAARPGITAGPERVGNQEGSWTVPVATGRADGAITTLSGRRIAIRNWRSYHDHNWGSFDLASPAYQGWEWAAVHEAPGHAWLLGGINRLDGRFDGILVHVTPTRTTACRPTISRQQWTTVHHFRLPLTVTATCNSHRVIFHVLRPYVVAVGSRALSESIARTNTPGSIGLLEHFGSR